MSSALAKKFNRDLYVMNMKSFGGSDGFESCLEEMRPNSILLIEDIDSYFDGRKSKTKITFSEFLNAISGVKCKQNVILIITTNKKDGLDEALVRSGRIDMAIEIGYANAREVNAYVKNFYGVDPELDNINAGIAMSDIENICISNKTNYTSALDGISKLIESKKKYEHSQTIQ